MPATPPDEHLLARIKKALDVSGAFDNCFFHTYALHLLANDLPLPPDLFTFKSIVGKDSHASKLQALFPNPASLSLFTEYAKRHPSQAQPTSPEFIVEKTMVLGFLLREWFATRTRQIDNITVLARFTEFKAMMKNNFGTDGERMLLQILSGDGNGVLYNSNAVFLKYFTTRPIAGSLNPAESRFEKYFTDASDAPDKAIEAYWKAEGLQNYCEELAKPGTKVAYYDICHVMELLQQPLTIFNTQTGIEKNIPGKANELKMEVMIDVGAGHYKLLKTEKTTPLLESYHKSLEQYLKDREAIQRLEDVADRVYLAKAKPSLFVEAICIPHTFGKAPFDLLLDKVADLKKYVSGPPQQILEQQQMAEAEKQRNQEIAQQLQAKKAAAEQIRLKVIEETQRKAAEARSYAAKVQSKATDVQRHAAEVQRKAADVQRHAMEVLSKAADVQHHAIEVLSKAADVQRHAIEVLSKTIEQQPIATDVPKKAVEIHPSATDVQSKAAEAQRNAVELQQKASEAKLAAQELHDAEEELLGPKEILNPHQEELMLKRAQAEVLFYNQLEHLVIIIASFDERKSKSKKSADRESLKNARNAATTLYNGLDGLAANYFKLKNPRLDEYTQFKTACEKLIKPARKVLDKHRGLSQIFANLALALLTAGIGILIKGAINKLVLNRSFFFVHETQSSKSVDDIEDSINKAAPEA